MGLINMRINEKLYGFTIKNIRQCDKGEFVEMLHDKTGAPLAWMNNGEENKLFCIAFKTVPEDNTGVFHIIEHSVLGGSEKYPVKEPFLYLLKGSMNTFLNAMTYPDMTMYPVSSRNNKDFMNLAEVYFDAVFKPLIYTVPDIFYQEGHHTEYNGNPEEAVYKGVVFNEMKGYISSVHERIESEMNRLLFPDTSYQYEFGGLPTEIPDLEYEQFLDTHKRFYHPSNSYIYLDGAVDLNEILSLIDSYLSEYDSNGEKHEIAFQKPIDNKVKELYYDSSEDDESDSKAFLAVGKILSSWKDREKNAAFGVLCEAIAGCNDAPLKKDILDTKLCLDLDLTFSDGILQPVGVLKFNNIERENGSALIEAAEKSAEKLAEQGIGKDILEAAINRCEFRYRESEEPKGLTRCIDSMSSWLYGGDPLMYIDRSEVFDNLRKKLDSKYFEELLSEWLLDKSGRSVLYMLPSETYGEEQAEKERQRVLAEISAMSEDEKTELIELNRRLTEWQSTPDSEEAILTLPRLSLSEISAEPIDFITEEIERNGVKILSHPVREPEITVMTLFFDVSDFSIEEIQKLLILDKLIAELPTKKSSGQELQRRIIGTLGNLSTNIIPMGKENTPEKCRVFFEVKTRFLSRNTVEALELIAELLLETEYKHPDTASMQLRQDEEDMKQEIISEGHRFSVRRTTARTSAESAMIEYIRGYEAYEALCRMNQLSEDDFSELLHEINGIAKRIFCKSRMTVSAGTAGDIDISPLTDMLPTGEPCTVEEMKFIADIPENSCIIIPSATAYSGAVTSERTGDKAVWSVASTIITYEYLWNEVRVKGGAYGSGCNVNNMKEACFHSYCDPSPMNSLEIFEKSANFLMEYCNNNPDITSYIISSIASGEPLLTDAEYADASDGMYFRGVTYESRRKLRSEMLSMTAEKLICACDDLQKTFYSCAIGSEEVIKQTTKKFPERKFDIKKI